MITAIKEISTINGGQVVLPPLDFPDGTQAEVIVLVREMDATEYLLSTEANRQQLLDSIKDAEEHPEKRIIYNNLDELKKDSLQPKAFEGMNYWLRNDRKISLGLWN